MRVLSKTIIPAASDKERIMERIILGIDPGSNIMGFALLKCNASGVTLLSYGIERFSGGEGEEHLIKVKQVFERTIALIDKWLPDEMAIESPFYGKNIQAMLKLGRAQGAAISAALSREIPVVEYAPKRVKMSVTGKGNATKEQVAYMMKAILKIADADAPKTFDATDALAIAYCHYSSKATPGRASKSWSAFVEANKDRVV
jgi:crossover junction endodeoxyribonuclease RuvC